MPIIDTYLALYKEQIRPLEKALSIHQEALVMWPTGTGSERLTEAREELETARHDLFASFCDELIGTYVDEDFPTALIDYLYSGDHDIATPESWRDIERRASLFASPMGQGIQSEGHSPSP